ncbi:hypothetical protein AMECASPLE_016786 [Ameca splendens]|uniref:Uncharacterized protein n=1 Tax=Ameca splendens TaxID=208324 RepID=A0ABV0YP83_9TELE
MLKNTCLEHSTGEQINWKQGCLRAPLHLYITQWYAIQVSDVTTSMHFNSLGRQVNTPRHLRKEPSRIREK